MSARKIPFPWIAPGTVVKIMRGELDGVRGYTVGRVDFGLFPGDDFRNSEPAVLVRISVLDDPVPILVADLLIDDGIDRRRPQS